MERYGYKRTMGGACLLMKGTIFALFFAPDVRVLMVGEVCCGVPW